jgi:hypothetical protein
MNKQNDGLFNMNNEYLPLAQWLQQILATTPQHPNAGLVTITENSDQFDDAYHLAFYRQLPDFVHALLNNATQETIIRFAPLVFHLIGCPTCHEAYIEIYDSMRATIGIDETPTMTSPLPQSITTTSTRVLVFTCQLLIQQAAQVLREARHEHSDHVAWARSLLQQAIYLSSHVMQSTQRQRALQDLVKVATFFEDTTTPPEHSYLPVLSAGSGPRQGKIRRRAETLERPGGQAAIYLQTGLSRQEGMITQNQDVLELHLEELGQELRGRFLIITIPFGSLLEPVRWVGGNPRAIRSNIPVGEDGSLTTPLGRTDLELSNLEDHNLLEAMFTKLNIRPVDY